MNSLDIFPLKHSMYEHSSVQNTQENVLRHNPLTFSRNSEQEKRTENGTCCKPNVTCEVFPDLKTNYFTNILMILVKTMLKSWPIILLHLLFDLHKMMTIFFFCDILKADLHGTTLSYAINLRQVYDMNRFV